MLPAIGAPASYNVRLQKELMLPTTGGVAAVDVRGATGRWRLVGLLVSGMAFCRTGSFASAFVLCGFILTAGALAYWLLMNDTVGSPEEA
jgi:hypothetical protein